MPAAATWEDDDRVGEREEAARADRPDERRHGDEGVGGEEVAAQQEPGDHGPEAPAAETPLVEQVEIAALPAHLPAARRGSDGRVLR
jgi:hypothetical protein